jgi:hypothetical protein
MKKVKQVRELPRKRNSFAKLLSQVSTPDAVTSLYYAGRLLQRRNDVKDIHQGFRVVGVSSEPTDNEQNIALTLINRIEQMEGHPVQSLTDRQAAKYISRFGKIASRKSRIQYGYTASKGKELLANLRSGAVNRGI